MKIVLLACTEVVDLVQMSDVFKVAKGKPWLQQGMIQPLGRLVSRMGCLVRAKDATWFYPVKNEKSSLTLADPSLSISVFISSLHTHPAIHV